MHRFSTSITVPVSGIALFIVVFLTACDSSATNPEDAPPASTIVYDPYPWTKTELPTYGKVYVTAQTTPLDNAPIIASWGELHTTTEHDGTMLNGGVMTVNSMQIPYSEALNYFSSKSSSFGTTSAWGLSGNKELNIPSFSTTMYVPAVIHIQSPYESALPFLVPFQDVNKPLTIEWNADPQNDSIIIGFTHNINYSWYRKVPDNGSFTIPADAFSDIPENSRIDLVLSRGNSKIAGTESYPIHIYTFTQAMASYTAK